MGLYASYYAVADDELTSSQNDDVDPLNDIYKNHKERYCDLDKMWHGLLFLLTGITDETDEMSGDDETVFMAIYGTDELYEGSDEEGVAYNDKIHVKKIADTLQKFNIDELLADMDFVKFDKHNIYPNIWHDDNQDDFDEIKTELKDSFKNLLAFYQNCAKADLNVVVSIN